MRKMPGLESTSRAETNGWATPRMLLRPRPGFYVMRSRHRSPLFLTLVYQVCPMVIPRPSEVGGPNPGDWCRPHNRSPRHGALIDSQPAAVDRVRTSHSLRPVSLEEYAFRIGPCAAGPANPGMPEARPARPIDLAALPPLF